MNITATLRQAGPACKAQQQQQATQLKQQAVTQRRRQLLTGLGAAAAVAVALRPSPVAATGIESIDLPQLELPQGIAEKKARNQQVLDDAEKAFQESDLLKTLKARSEANRSTRKKELENLYCMRQAELGVGDCGGLRLIPGMTKSGVQKRPEWLNDLLGLPEQD